MSNFLNQDQIRNIPKVEFHRHLDGSVRLETIHELNKKNNLGIQYNDLNDLRQNAFIQEPLTDLTAFIAALEITQKTLCNYEAIKRITFENVEDSFRDGVKLIELRFAPLYMLVNKNMKYDEVIEGVCDGFLAGLEKYDIQGSLIYIQPRGFSSEEIQSDMKKLCSYLKKGGKYSDNIKGFDVADEETLERIIKFEPIVNQAKKAGLEITVHSGEDTNPELMNETIKRYNPKRIGHGIRAIDSEETMQTLKDKDICLELCVHSNYLTKASPIKEEHPLPKFFQNNVPFNISTDDPHILETNLISEYQFINQVFQLTVDDLFTNNLNNLNYSFCDIDKVGYVRKKFFKR